ncbi:relaxase/mobilization nuclease domain-containing protein [Pedobacter sp. HDW13]|uniref:relaxase/mobilization nuclease domain-containing protein n=1 Tax=Pedobacter sp. HDW13 TaxID=2714940 RepID=UPI0014088F62|nr:relaxase/mobilization nuclease domain-containing protein [Pedobacter sp. HDW13]QIL40635.1 relaxase/mobilization nuclease domain-containing protein [Pedobacter sp. HDW13]
MNTVIVRLFTKSNGFPAVSYNMDKVNASAAELLSVRNMDLLKAYSFIRSIDIEHYFGAIASLNTRSHFDQFHAVLSTKGVQMDKQVFLDIAHKWMEAMGYKRQPYLIFLHTDTPNRHIHIVSTDVRLDGSKISDSFDRIRAVTELNRICGVDEAKSFQEDISRLIKYRCSSTAQLEILFKQKGYRFFSHKDNFLVRKYGKTLIRIPSDALLNSLSAAKADFKRIGEIKSFISSAMFIHNRKPEPIYQLGPGRAWRKIIAYRSDLADFLHSAANLEVVYLFSRRTVTGFMLIDHHTAQLFAGEELTDLHYFMGSLKQQSPALTPSHQH